MDLSSHNTNPPGVFDGEAVPLSDVAETRIEESVAALREFVAEHGRLRRQSGDRFGSFREALQRAALT